MGETRGSSMALVVVPEKIVLERARGTRRLFIGVGSRNSLRMRNVWSRSLLLSADRTSIESHAAKNPHHRPASLRGFSEKI